VHFDGKIIQDESGKLEWPKTFYNTRDGDGKPFSFRVGRGESSSFFFFFLSLLVLTKLGAEETIPGLEKAVKTMKEGEIAIITIKPHFAYSSHGNQQVFGTTFTPFFF
jgi:hypothetical protein